ncbi:MAG: hypothetical protein AAF414_23825 [Pseudomonadota bacterium]
MHAVRLAASALLALAIISPAAAQDDTDPAINECIDAVGTYLTLREYDGGSIDRSLISLTNGGHAFLTDSAQGGVRGYQPFSDARGTWRCLGADNGQLQFEALILDFTFADGDEPDRQIARLDITASYDPANGALTGNAALSFTPLSGNPLDSASLESNSGYEFTGIRVAFDD